jgi:hypothetical protein
MLQLGCRRLKEPARRDSLWSEHCQRDWALPTPLRSALLTHVALLRRRLVAVANLTCNAVNCVYYTVLIERRD